MECGFVEERLSEYVEHSLPQEEMVQVAEHLHGCPGCMGLMEEIRSLLVTCQAFPTYEADAALLDRILLRTSGKPRSRPLLQRLRAFFLRPILTPRFAAGVGLALLFLALAVDLMMPRMNILASALSGQGLLSQLDRGVQKIYSEGLKLYDQKNEWQAQFTFYKNNMFKRLGNVIEQLDVPVEGQKKPAEQKQPDKGPKQKSSVSLLYRV